MPRGAKWAIVLLSILCVVLLGALLEVAFLPQLIERDINNLLQRMAGDGVEFRIKTISLTSAEVACKLKDTTRGGRPLNVGSIGSLSLRYTPISLMFDRTIESIEIENCNVVADYSDGSVSIPAWELFAGKFQSGEKKEKEAESSAPADDLNAVIPVRIGRVALSGSLAAVARGEDAVDTLHIPYAITVRPDPEQGWNKIDCSFMVHFATNGIRCKATYLHKEKKVALDLDDFSLATTALPGTIRSGLPRGLRAGISMNAKAEIDLNSLTLQELENSSLELKGDLMLGYRTPQGLRIDSDAPFSLKTVPRVIPTVKPMNPPKTEMLLVFTLGGLKGEYDAIPFGLDGLEASVSLRRKTLQGGFRLTVAESEPAEFSFGGGMDGEQIALDLGLENNPLLKVRYKDAEVACRPDKLTANVKKTGDGFEAETAFAFHEIQTEADAGAFKPELKGLTAFFKPEQITGNFNMAGSEMAGTVDVSGGEFQAKYKGAEVACRPDKLTANVKKTGDGFEAETAFAFHEIQTEADAGAFKPELKGLTAFFKPEQVTGNFNMAGSEMAGTVDVSGGEFHAKYKGMDVTFRPEGIGGAFRTEGEQKVFSVKLKPGELGFKKEGINASFKPESLQADVTWADGLKEASAELKGGKLLTELNNMTCEADTLAFNAESKDGKKFDADAKIDGFLFKQLAAGLTYEALEIKLNNAAFDLESGILSGEAVCEDSGFAMPKLKLLAKDLHGEFPFDLSFAAAEPDGAEAPEKAPAAAPRTGKVSLGSLEYDGKKAASLDGTILWDDAAKTLRLKTDAQLLSIDGQIYANVALGAEGVETECGFDIPEQQADLSKDLAQFFPQFEEISCTGKVEGSAVYKLLPKITTGNAKFRIADADVLIPEKKLEVHGIDFGFEIPEIAVLKSAPGQTLSFKSVKFDKIETGAGKFAFRMEAPDTWQIENALLDWCNGHIRLGGVTYRKGQTITEVVLYCDRLELPVFLTQIGVGRISGSGAINGTIPVVLSQESGQFLPDNVYFEDAFLFSTPGEDGVIQGDIDESILNAESGIEMELAKDALKDFSYSWVRMSMLSTGRDKGDLKLSLQLDGRPNRALYYAFDEKTASFIKSPTPCIFQGIRLDTNVNVESGKALELVDYAKKIFSKGH